jgi:hypothetical protein
VGVARATAVVLGGQEEAEEHWYDLQRWPGFVDGFAAVARVEGDWPGVGAVVVWDSRPHGRGRVREVVTDHLGGVGQDVEVEDGRLRGVQRVRFTAEDHGTRVSLELDYELKERNALTPLVDPLFIRRALRDALRRTVERFARERRGDLELA